MKVCSNNLEVYRKIAYITHTAISMYMLPAIHSHVALNLHHLKPIRSSKQVLRMICHIIYRLQF